jgi:hypothetical protein
MEKKHWEIALGRTWQNNKSIDVVCTDEELKIICNALVDYEEKMGRTPTSCVAFLNGGASPYRQPDYVYCDCM